MRQLAVIFRQERRALHAWSALAGDTAQSSPLESHRGALLSLAGCCSVRCFALPSVWRRFLLAMAHWQSRSRARAPHYRRPIASSARSAESWIPLRCSGQACGWPPAHGGERFDSSSCTRKKKQCVWSGLLLQRTLSQCKCERGGELLHFLGEGGKKTQLASNSPLPRYRPVKGHSRHARPSKLVCASHIRPGLLTARKSQQVGHGRDRSRGL